MTTFSSTAAQSERDKLFPPESVAAIEQQQAQGRSFDEYRANRPDYSVLPTPDELAAQEGERESERAKGDGRGDATHIAASKPLPGDELAAVAYGFKEGETPNERALQNAQDTQPSNDGAVFAAAAILATEQSSDQQAERDKLFPPASVEAVEQQQAQERGFEQYRANGENYAALKPQQEQEGPAPTRPGEQAEQDKLYPPASVAAVEQQAASMGRQHSMGYGLG